LTVRKPWATYMRIDPKHVVRRVKFIEIKSLFIPSRLSMRWSMKSSVEVNLQGRSTEKVKLLLKSSHLEP
jgi:hypothetical protein